MSHGGEAKMKKKTTTFFGCAYGFPETSPIFLDMEDYMAPFQSAGLC